jgi:hypothetical protein
MKKVFLFISACLVFFSYKKQDSSPATVNFITADINGVQSTFNLDDFADFVNSGTYLTLSGDHDGNNLTNSIDFDLMDSLRIKTTTYYPDMHYIDASGNSLQGNSSVTVTSFTASNVQGTFYATLPETFGTAGDSVYITNGKFNLAVTNDNGDTTLQVSPLRPIVDTSKWNLDGADYYTANKSYFGTNEYATYGLNAQDSSSAGDYILEINFKNTPTAGTYKVIDYQVDYPASNQCYINAYLKGGQYMSYDNPGENVTITVNNGKIKAVFSNISIFPYGTNITNKLSGSITQQ